MKWQPDLRLTDGQLVLRPYLLSDSDVLFEAVRESVAELQPWMPWCHPEYKRRESAEWLARLEELWTSDAEFNFAITEAGGNRYLGGCGINGINWPNRFGNLGYWVRTSAVGRGIATEASRLLAEFGFASLGLRRLELVVQPDNGASIRVAEKLGAALEGLQHGRLAVGKEQRDALMFSLLERPPQRAT